MVSKLVQKDVNIADFGIEAITDNGRVQLSENKKGPLSVDTYNKMIDPNDKEFAMADTDNAPEEVGVLRIFVMTLPAWVCLTADVLSATCGGKPIDRKGRRACTNDKAD